MTVIQGLNGAITGSAGGGGGPPPSPNFAAAFDSDDLNRGVGGQNGWWTVDGNYTDYSIFSTPAPAWNAITYPNSANGHTYDFDGTAWMIGPAINNNGDTYAITINFWFYPTANNVQLLSELQVRDPSSGYHYTILELDSSNYIQGRFWPNITGLQSSNTVNLNAWNHVYYTQIWNGYQYLQLNGTGGASNTAPIARGSGGNAPASSAFAFGHYDTTNIGRTNRFQGKIGHFQYENLGGTSNFATYQARYGL